MTLTQLSNLWNLIVQAHPELKSYHFGWRSDVNVNTANNYDPTNDLGSQYPRVHFTPPIGNFNTQDANNSIKAMLFFDDLQGYDNEGNLTKNTKAEQWSKLFVHAFQFFRTARQSTRKLANQSLAVEIQNVTYTYDSDTHNRRLISIVCECDIIAKVKCNDLNLDLTQFNPEQPFPVAEWDYEDPNNQ